MSRQLIKSIMIVFVFLASFQASAQSQLAELRSNVQNTLQSLQNPSVSNLHRMQLIQQQKETAEESMRVLIENRTVNPDDLANPQSEASLAFQAMDQLSILAALRLKPNSNQMTEISCLEARGMLQMVSAMPSAQPTQLGSTPQRTMNLLNQMCQGAQ